MVLTSKKKSSVSISKIEKGTLDAVPGFEKFAVKHEKILFWVSLCLAFVLSVMLFDVKMSEGNDDSDYIEGAFKFSKDFKSYYNVKAPLYPMLLSIPVSIWGMNVPLLKSFSIVFNLLQIVLLYYSFRKVIPLSILFAVLLFIATNSYFLYFSSQTYTEAFFCFLQALLFLFIYKSIADPKKGFSKELVWIGFTLFLLTLTKNISIGAILAVSIFYLLIRKYKTLLYVLGTFLLFRIPFEITKSMIWGTTSQFSNQYQILIQKDPYNAAKGVDHFWGFMGRLSDNTMIYIGKRFYQITGLVSDDTTTYSPGLVFIFSILILLSVFAIIRRSNRLLLFTLIYTLVMAGLTFFVLQTNWDQPRMVMVYVPFMLMLIYSGIYYVFSSQKILRASIFTVMVILFSFGGLFKTMGKAVNNLGILKHNLSGDSFYGYTDDWSNFLKLSRYCGDSLPEKSLVASRKAPMSFIYARGKEFYPVYTVFSSDPDSTLAILKRDHVTHVLIASLRRNPKKKDGYVINTLHRLFVPIAQKYPEKLKLIKQVGESEPAYLYEIRY